MRVQPLAKCNASGWMVQPGCGVVCKEKNMKMKIMAVALARLRAWNWSSFLKKIARAFSPGLKKLGEILVISGAASLGFKGIDGNIGFLGIKMSSVDIWWSIAILVMGLIVWALAVAFDEKKACQKDDE
jgi:hypothetical protein